MFINKILYNVIKYILLKLTFLCCKFNFIYFQFLILRFFISKFKFIDNKKKTILIIRKSAGFEDVMASINYSKIDKNVLVLPRNILKKIFITFLSKNLFRDKYYFSKIIKKAEREKYKIFMDDLIKKLKKRYNIRLIIAFNVMYKEVHQVAKSCKKIDVNFLTLQKESIFSKARSKILKKFYETFLKEYHGTHISTYNNLHKEIFLNSGYISEDKINVTGCPRLDYSFMIKKNNTNLNILYFSISKRAGLPYYDNKFTSLGLFKIKKFDWRDLKKNTENFLLEYKKREKIDITIKYKTGISEEEKIIKKFENTGIQIIRNSTGHELLKNASIVIAFNSTTIFEAIAAKIPVIIPYFKISPNQKNFVFEINKSKNVYIVKNKSMFFKTLDLLRKKNKKYTANNIEKNVLFKFMGNNKGESKSKLNATIKNLSN